MSRTSRFLVMTLVAYGALLTIVTFSGGFGAKFSVPHLLSILLIGPVAALIGVFIQDRLAALLGGAFTGASTAIEKPTPVFSKARAHVLREEWEEARAELDEQWKRCPGNTDVLREYDRLFMDGMKAPSGLADLYKKILPQIHGEDRAFIYLRLAELNSDHIDKKSDAHFWCSRLLTEFPASRHAGAAREMAEQTKPRN